MKYLLIFLVLVLVSACSSNEETPKTEYIKIQSMSDTVQELERTFEGVKTDMANKEITLEELNNNYQDNYQEVERNVRITEKKLINLLTFDLEEKEQ